MSNGLGMELGKGLVCTPRSVTLKAGKSHFSLHSLLAIHKTTLTELRQGLF